MENLLYWIWLSLSCTPGSETFIKLLNSFSTPENIFSQDDTRIASVIGTRCSDYHTLIDRDLARAESVLEFCISKGVGILTYSDKRFPQSLREISNPPVLLYYRGVLPDFDTAMCISVVGTRSLSDYGRKNAFHVSRDLANAGATIVSGMAIGIDGVALAGALSAGAPTIAVIGSGIDVCYPHDHVVLAREIVKKGCVFTEYAPGTQPDRQNFPRRNRIISGLSPATLIVEGRERSGALITARCAKEQGRRVFAFPGNVGNKNSEATNLLIKNGAFLFTSADDVISALEKDFVGKLNPFKLTIGDNVNMNDALTKYRVSCVTPSDDVFKKPSRRKPEKTAPYAKKEETATAVDELPKIDGEVLSLYKKIPIDGDIDINSLMDSEHTFKDVMKGLLKLDMLKMVNMLPGDRVSRKLK